MKLGAALAGVRTRSDARGIALKVKGQLVACTAINPSAEPNSLMVCIDFPARDALIEKKPDTYYTTSHYRDYATVVVRLAKVGYAEMRDLLEQAVQFVGAQHARKKPAKKPGSKPANDSAKRPRSGRRPAKSARS
jgi:hypothetical protein